VIRALDTLKIRTPEGVVFALPLAGPVARFLALLVDLACIGALTAAVSQVLASFSTISLDLARGLTVVLYFALSVGYAMALEWFWRGQTIGKRVLGLRVVDREGLRLTAPQVVLRNLIRPLDMLPSLYAVGGIAMAFTRYSQRLGDLAANTIVIQTRKVQIPDVEQLRTGKYNSLRDYPHLAARLRRNVPPDAVAIAADAILRRDQFEPAARLALFRDMADWFRGVVQFPPEATEDIADEQYVRNVLEVVLSPGGAKNLELRHP
jgi:uncharacterized RDD family membrane protein YckC